MSASDKLFPVSAADDIWHQNKAQIRDLYQNQRKTVKEVKYLMEAYGFPVKPLSTWETKTRDVLQLRKKAKSTNWPLIYQHVIPRLKKPGQKQLRKETSIYLNNLEIPWNKAWKEIRRSGAITLPLPQKSPSPLPHGITTRTPSPVQGLSTVTARASQLTVEVLPEHFKFEHKEDFVPIPYSTTAPTAQIGIVDDASGPLARYAVSVYQDCAATILWVDLYQALQYLFQDTFQAWRLHDDLLQENQDCLAAIITHRVKRVRTYELNINSPSCFELLPDGYPIPPFPSHDL
ncbi:hypothetical protein INS49_002584 [Diaporthe citri]|uniref:uncharacterized protein n=1 Tax=Diaporthe citri TaxID=83186 RepID=UPI001C806404|nr:uncharacterized protein INS49_002584 [Diaporthe citri]KAG6368378.1 hypothetical protein INS49_002584 [Diaporthe citri]